MRSCLLALRARRPGGGSSGVVHDRHRAHLRRARPAGRERRGRAGSWPRGPRGWIRARGRSIVTDVTVARSSRRSRDPTYARTHRSSFWAAPSATTRCGSTACREFAVGDRDVLFINEAGRPASPARRVHVRRFRIMRDPADRRGHGADARRTAARQHRGRRQRRPPAPRVAPARTLSLARFRRRNPRQGPHPGAGPMTRGAPRANGARLLLAALCGRVLSSYVLIERQVAGRHGDDAAAARHAGRALSDGSIELWCGRRVGAR